MAARSALERAEDAAASAVDAERVARLRLDDAVSNERRRTKALAATEPQRVKLSEALAELDAGLDDTRTARVAALSAEAIVPAHLVAVLGEPPGDTAGRQAWCGPACRIESYRDRHPEALGHEIAGGVMAALGSRQSERWVPDPEWDDLGGQLRHGSALVTMAAEINGGTRITPVGAEVRSWADILDQAGMLLEARRQTTERGLDRGLGLGL